MVWRYLLLILFAQAAFGATLECPPLSDVQRLSVDGYAQSDPPESRFYSLHDLEYTSHSWSIQLVSSYTISIQQANNLIPQLNIRIFDQPFREFDVDTCYYTVVSANLRPNDTVLMLSTPVTPETS